MKIEDLEKYKEAARVVKPQVDLEMYEMSPNARGEGEYQLTLRMKREGAICREI